MPGGLRGRGPVLGTLIASSLMLVTARGYRVLAASSARYADAAPLWSIRKTNNGYPDPGQALGAPDGRWVSLGGVGRWIVLEMGLPVPDRPGNDLFVHEVGNAERYYLSVGQRPTGPFTPLGVGEGPCLFDLGRAAVPSCRYVRIDDLGDPDPVRPGCDIDAVEHVLTGEVRLEIREAGSGVQVPGRVTLVGVPPTPTPAFNGDLAEDRPTLHRSGNRVMTSSGQETIGVPHGLYDFSVSRGPEYDLVTGRIQVGPTPVDLRATLTRVVNTAGWVASDLHIHGPRSWDCRLLEDGRAVSILAEGLEAGALTDHDYVADLNAALQRLQRQNDVLLLPGAEVTTSSHYNGFPMTVVPGHPRGGAIDHTGLRPAEIFAAIRASSPAEKVVQVNHPRMGGIGYFNNHNLDPQTGISTDPRFSTAFDAIEVFNGVAVAPQEETVLRDWCNLTNRGVLATATGNSDSHRSAWNTAGWPRTFVAVPDSGPPGAIPPADLVAALRARRAVVSYGPFIELTANGSGRIGDLVLDTDGQVSLDIRVQAPLWMDLTTIELWANGTRLLSFPPDPGSSPLRFSRVLDVPVTRDSWFHVRAFGTRLMTPVVPGFVPFAFTNGIFVDFDGNGRFDPFPQFAPSILEVEPGELVFENVATGGETRLALSTRSRHRDPLEVVDVSVTGEGFRLVGDRPRMLRFEQTESILIGYRPLRNEEVRGELRLDCGDGIDVRVPLIGRPTPER